MARQFGHGGNVLDELWINIRTNGEIVRHAPEKDLVDQLAKPSPGAYCRLGRRKHTYLSIIGARSNQIIVERVPKPG